MRRKRTISFYSREEMLQQETETEETEFVLKEESEFYPEIVNERYLKLLFLSDQTTEKEDEEILKKQINQMNHCYKNNASLTENKLLSCQEIVCSCLKEILYENKSILKPTRAFSFNSLDDIKFKSLIDSYLKESQYFRLSLESTSTTTSYQESMREILNQNLIPEEELKLLIVSNSTILKNQSLTSFIEEEIADDYIVKGVEFRKKKTSINNKVIKVTIFNTERDFFVNQIGNIYLNVVNAVIIFLDTDKCDSNNTINDAVLFLQNHICQLTKSGFDKEIIVIEHNSQLEQKYQRGFGSIKQYCKENNIIYIFLQSVFDFEIKNSRITSLIKLLLIKKKSSFNKGKERIDKGEDTDDEVINEMELLSYDSKYKLKPKTIKSNNQSLNSKKNKRKWTMDQ